MRASCPVPCAPSPLPPGLIPGTAPIPSTSPRFQSQLLHAKRYHHVLPTLATIAREEGPAAMYKVCLRGGACLLHACACNSAGMVADVDRDGVPPPPGMPPLQGFLPKAVRLGVGQSIGLIVFQNLLAAFGVEERDAAAGAAQAEQGGQATLGAPVAATAAAAAT